MAATDGVSSVVLYGPDSDYKDLVFVGIDDPARVVETAATTGTHFVEVVDVQRSKGAYSLALTADSDSGTPTQTATATPTPTATPLDDDYGTQTYGEYGYGGVDA